MQLPEHRNFVLQSNTGTCVFTMLHVYKDRSRSTVKDLQKPTNALHHDKNDNVVDARIVDFSYSSRKHLRTKVTPDLHLTYSKNDGNLGSESQ